MNKPTMIVLLAIAACILVVGVRWVNSRSQPRHTLGVVNGRLANCPDYQNCVSTQASDSRHRLDPIPFTQSAELAQAHVKSIIESMPRSRVVKSESGYLHAEFSSLLLGFVDDVEVMIDASQGLIHFRSASRTGQSDLGVNRKRMESIRQRFQQR